MKKKYIYIVSNHLHLDHFTSEKNFFHLIYDSTKINLREYLRIPLILGDKLSSKKINIKRTIIVRKKLKCELCQEYYEEYDMLKF